MKISSNANYCDSLILFFKLNFQAFRRVLRPAANWGPADPENRVGKYYDGPAIRKNSMQSSTTNMSNGIYPASVFNMDMKGYDEKSFNGHHNKTFDSKTFDTY